MSIHSNAKKMNRALSVFRDKALPEAELQTLQVFLEVASQEDSKTPRSVGELANLIGHHMSTAARAVFMLSVDRGKGVQGAGVLEATPDESDRRIRRITLTQKGRALLLEMFKEH